MNNPLVTHTILWNFQEIWVSAMTILLFCCNNFFNVHHTFCLSIPLCVFYVCLFVCWDVGTLGCLFVCLLGCWGIYLFYFIYYLFIFVCFFVFFSCCWVFVLFFLCIEPFICTFLISFGEGVGVYCPKLPPLLVMSLYGS